MLDRRRDVHQGRRSLTPALIGTQPLPAGAWRNRRASGRHKSVQADDQGPRLKISPAALAIENLRPGIARQNGAYYHGVMRTISLKLPDNLLALLGDEAKARQVTKSRLVRESLENALRKQPPSGDASCYGLSSDLAGAVKGLPEDLADNPKYMEGFGR